LGKGREEKKTTEEKEKKGRAKLTLSYGIEDDGIPTERGSGASPRSSPLARNVSLP